MAARTIRELKVDATRYGIDAEGMKKHELIVAVDAARAASEARKLARPPVKKRKTDHEPARGEFVIEPDDLSFSLGIKLVPQPEDDRLYALRLMDTYTKHLTAEQSQAIINTPRAAYLATQTQKDRDALKEEHWGVQADILCKAPIASLCVDDVRYGPYPDDVDLEDKAALPPKLDDDVVVFEGPEIGFYDEKTDYELKEPLPDGKLTCAALKDLVERFERECRTRQSQSSHGIDISHYVFFEGVYQKKRNVYCLCWGS